MGALLDLAMSDEPALPPVTRRAEQGRGHRPDHPHGGGTDSGELPPLSLAQEAAHREMLVRLEGDPAVRRVFTSRWEDGNFVITLAIRGVGTGELLILGDRIGREDLKAYDALLDCLNTPASPS